jgi:hypothetical protein
MCVVAPFFPQLKFIQGLWIIFKPPKTEQNGMVNYSLISWKNIAGYVVYTKSNIAEILENHQ